MFSTLGLRVRAHLARMATKAKDLLREVSRPFPLVSGVLRDLTRSRKELIAENALLRQQLIVASRKVKRPAFKPHERGLVVLLSRVVRGWRDALLLVKPETVVRWHREAFRLFCRWKSRSRKAPAQRIPDDVVALIRRMARENCRTHPGRTAEAGHHGRQADHPADPARSPAASSAKPAGLVLLERLLCGLACSRAAFLGGVGGFHGVPCQRPRAVSPRARHAR